MTGVDHYHIDPEAQTITVYPSMAGSVAECARMLMAQIDE